MSAPRGIVIVGTGIAGVSAAAALRTAGYHGPLCMVGEETHLPYRRPTVSKDLVRGDKSIDQVLIKPERWYIENDIELLLGRRAVALDPVTHRLTLEGGDVLPYDRLLLATGGRARAPWEGDRIRTLRTASDAACLGAALEGVSSVVVVGAGLVGSEVAASLRALGREVTLLESAPDPLPRLLPADLAQRYVALHKEHGTSLETDVSVASVEVSGDEVVVSAADGRSWRAGLAVVAVGMQPDTGLAESAGLTVDGGVVVDVAGRTSAPDVFAAGDLAVRPSTLADPDGATVLVRSEHWQAAQNHGTAVGRAMAGEEVVFDEVPWAWSDQYSVTLQVTGWPDVVDDLVLRLAPDGPGFTAFSVRSGILRGAVTVGRPADVRAARSLVGRRARVSPERLRDPGVPVDETVVP